MRATTRSLLPRADPIRFFGPTLTEAQELQIARYAMPIRREIRRLMRGSTRVCDLAGVFPGALFAIATGYGSAEARREALEHVEAGAALKSVARTLGLPTWLRRIPPEAFTGPLGPLPSSETFSRKISARLPPTTSQSAFWLATVTFAARACHEEFALWLAAHQIYSEPGDAQRIFAILAAYAWFSNDPLTRSQGMIGVPWRPEIAFDTALCAAKSWFNRVRLLLQVGSGVIEDTWLTHSTVNGLTFVPLLGAREILDEAQAMQNCADQYADKLARDRCRLFGIRRGASRVATMEIGPHQREAGVLAINQLKLRHNMPASLDVWQAAHAWMAQQTGLKRMPTLSFPERQIDQKAWRELMSEYRRQKHGAPWLPETINGAALAMIDADMSDLARRGNVSSWLFT